MSKEFPGSGSFPKEKRLPISQSAAFFLNRCKSLTAPGAASRFYDFQARRLRLRYKDKDGKTHFCHTLNNTVIASPRILIPIIEMYQNPDGSITVPDVLRCYVNGMERIEARAY